MPPPSTSKIKTSGYPSAWKVLGCQCALWLVIQLGTTVSSLAQTAAPTAQDSSAAALQQLYTTGLTAFQSGDYQTAATNFENLITQAGDTPQLEAIYYTLGAAYYNLQNYPKAIEILTKYQTKFPKGARINDVLFSIGQANLMSKNYPAAVESFKKIENIPQMRDQALLYEGTAYKEAADPDNAIATLEKLVGTEIKSDNAASGAMILAGLYSEKHETDKALALLQEIQHRLSLVDNIVRINTLAVQLGDGLLDNKMPEEALGCYRMVRSRAEVIKFQSTGIATKEKQSQQILASLRADPTRAVQLVAQNNQLRSEITEARKLLGDFQNLPDFQPALWQRMARCFYEMGKRWEAIVVYEEFLQKYPDSPQREPALFGLTVASAEVNRPKKTQEYCAQYLKEFPQGPNVAAAGYLLGATALQTNDMAGAETYFGRMLVDQPDSTYREEIRFQLGNVRFAQAKYDDAAKDYTTYQTDFPTGTHLEEAVYRQALCSVFSGKYEEAMKRLTDYTGKYPAGNFLADAKYRLAVCLYAAQAYDQVITACRSWEAEFNADPMLGEVLSLLADALAASGKETEAIPIYVRSWHLATTNEVSDYSLFAAQKLMQKQGQWDQLGAMFEDFVKEKPDNPSAVTAVYWIGKAKIHDGKIDEAKTFIADTIKKYLGDPTRESVEQLIQQLAQLCVRKKPAIAAASPSPADATAVGAATPVATPSPTPAAAPVDPGAELDALLGGAGQDPSPTAKARILYAKSELARLRKQFPEQDKNLQAIADNFKPDGLSPMLLAQTGDYLLRKNQFTQAAPFFQRLMDEYPKSDLRDFAYNGLGEIAYQNKEYDQALQLFTDAIDKAGATQKLKDVTVGKAKTLLALNQLDEARKIFEQVASVREWRGEATAFSVYSLGEIAQKQSRLPQAIDYYQRVYVAYQRFLPWVAKAYLQSAACFEQLGKTDDAIKTYREMVNNEKLASFPEIEIARKKLGQ